MSQHAEGISKDQSLLLWQLTQPVVSITLLWPAISLTNSLVLIFFYSSLPAVRSFDGAINSNTRQDATTSATSTECCETPSTCCLQDIAPLLPLDLTDYTGRHVHKTFATNQTGLVKRDGTIYYIVDYCLSRRGFIIFINLCGWRLTSR
jgi:hypothetical protein